MNHSGARPGRVPLARALEHAGEPARTTIELGEHHRMTAAMSDEIHSDHRGHNPTSLRKGTLVHLWRPGDTPWHGGAIPVLGRVVRATAYNIIAVDLRDGVEGKYDVANELPGHRWSWSVAAVAQRAAVVDGIERIPGRHLTLEDRIALICGDAGAQVRFGMRDGSSVSGSLTAVIQDDPDSLEADWCELTGPVDARGQIRHWVRVADIVAVTRTDV